MSKNFWLIRAIFCLLVITSCSKPVDDGGNGGSGNTGGGGGNTTPDIYVGGMIYKNGRYLATFWKNGVSTIVSDTTKDSWGDGIFVSGNEVYLNIHQRNGIPNSSTIKLYKSGVVSNVTDGSRHVETFGIFVNGSDVYIGLTDYEGAKIWKNGTVTLMAPDASMSFNPIFVSGNDAYVAITQRIFSRGVAKYWKNGTLYNLGTPGRESSANSIFVSNGDVYVCGSEQASNGNYVAKYWKNGISVNLTDSNVNSPDNLFCITVSGNDVYVAGNGFQPGSNVSIPKYWKNGTELILDGPPAYPISMKIYNNDVYLAGFETTTGAHRAKYWKNTTSMVLNSDGYPSHAYSIFLK